MATSVLPSYLNPRGTTAIAENSDGTDILQCRAGNVLLFHVNNDGSITFPDGTTQSTAASGTAPSFAAFGSTPNANGGSVSGSVLTLQPADATHPGGVSILAQTFAGLKTLLAGAVSGVDGASVGIGYRALGQSHLSAFLGVDAGSGYPGVWFGVVPGSEGLTNYSILNVGDTNLLLNSAGGIIGLRISNSSVVEIHAATFDLTAAGTNPTNALKSAAPMQVVSGSLGTPAATGTINTAAGQFVVASGSATYVLTNSLLTAGVQCFVQYSSDPGSGAWVSHVDVNTTAHTATVNFGSPPTNNLTVTFFLIALV